MLQSSLFPGLFFHLCSSAHVTRFPVRNRVVSSAERQKLSRTSTKTPSTSKIRISGVRASRFRLRKVGKESSLSKPKVSPPSLSPSSLSRFPRFTVRYSSFGSLDTDHRAQFRVPILQRLFEIIIQLLRPDRFGQISVHARAQAFFPIAFHRVRSQCNDHLMFSARLLLLADRRGGFHSVHIRHLHVHQHQVESFLLERR